MDTDEEVGFEPTYLRRWPKPPAGIPYGGEDWSDFYVLMSHTRDNEYDPLIESNWEYATTALARGKDSCESETVRIASFGHWGCGWIAALMIHKSDEEALRIADRLAEQLRRYPCLDERDFTEREEAKCRELWGENPPDRTTLRERQDYWRSVRRLYDVSLFAIRRAYPPFRDHDEAGDYLRALLLE